MIRCENCGRLMPTIELDKFYRDGSDDFDSCTYEIYQEPFEDEDINVITIDTDNNWVGYDLSEEEMLDTIQCPHCHKYPFNDKEIQVYDIVRLVMFREE